MTSAAPGAEATPDQPDQPDHTVVAYRALGWPVRVRGEQISLNLDLELDAVAVVLPAGLAGRVAEILAGRRCPPAVLAHPALLAHRVILAGERFGVALGWPAGVHRVTGTLLLPPTVTSHGPVRWVRPPQLHALRLCREIDLCSALTTALREPPPSSPAPARSGRATARARGCAPEAETDLTGSSGAGCAAVISPSRR